MYCSKNSDRTFRCFKYDTIEDIIDALNKETIAVDWAEETIKQLCTMSPISLKVTIQLFQVGAKCSLLDCVKLEYRLASNHLVSCYRIYISQN